MHSFIRNRRYLAAEHLEARCLLAYGDLDLDFANNGKVDFYITSSYYPMILNSIVEDAPDEDLWLAGWRGDLGLLVHMDSQGTLDSSFDSDGYASYQLINAERTTFSSLKKLENGRLIVVGKAFFTGVTKPFVAQFLPTGELATDFADSGIFVGTPNSSLELFESNRNEIVLLESLSETTGGGIKSIRYSLLKLSNTGALDVGFGVQGYSESFVATTSFTVIDGSTYGGDPLLMRIAVNGDDQYVVAYREFDNIIGKWSIRSHAFSPDGYRDFRFGAGGIAAVHLEPGQLDYSLNIDAHHQENQFFCILSKQTHQEWQWEVRLLDLETGWVDSFGDAGAIHRTAEPNDYRKALIKGNDNLLLIDTVGEHFRVTRYDLNGLLDDTFGEQGYALSPFIGFGRIAQTQDENLLVFSSEIPDMRIQRIASNGYSDPDFGDGGSKLLRNNEMLWFVNDFQLASQPDSEFTLSSGGQHGTTAGWHYHFDMQLTWPSDRLWFIQPTHDLIAAPSLTAATQHGNFLTFRSSYAPALDGTEILHIDRYSPNGALIETYTVGTGIQKSFSSNHVLTRAADGYIYAIESGQQISGVRGKWEAVLTRFDAFGIMDTGWGENGSLTIRDLPSSVRDIAVMPNGIYLQVRSLREGLVPIQTDGTFGEFVELAPGANGGIIDDLLVQGQYLLILARINGESRIYRVDESGSIDGSFGNNGIQVLPFQKAHSSEPGLMIQHFDSLLIGRTTDGPFQSIEITVTDSAGLLREDFGSQGLINIDTSEGDDRLIGIGPLADGSFLVGMESRAERGTVGRVVHIEGPNANPTPWHYVRHPLNVTAKRGDTVVTSLDALLVIDHLNNPVPDPTDYVDTNGDNAVTPIDALRVINFLNSNSSRAEGEYAAIDYVLASINWDWFADIKRKK